MKLNKTNRLTKWLASITALAALAGSNTVQAQIWQTVLDFQLAPGKHAEGWGIVADTAGNVFSGGTALDASGISHGLVLKTDTTQANWYLSDDTLPSTSQDSSYVWNLGFDASGNLCSVGDLTGINFWYVRKSLDGGVNWSTVDLYQYAAGQGINPKGFAADSSGNIYVVGWGRDATRQHDTHWLVRKSTNGGQTWALVDDVKGISVWGAGFVPGAGLFVVGAGQDAGSSWLVRRSLDGGAIWLSVDGPFAGAATAVGSDSQGNIYVVGYKFITTKVHPLTGYYAWVTRRSSDGGNTWSTVDTFSYSPGAFSRAEAVGRDSSGKIVVVGSASDGVSRHWIVRRPSSSGAWETVDVFKLPAPAYAASALGVVTDAVGNLLVTGYANDGAKTEHWIVRRLANTAP